MRQKFVVALLYQYCNRSSYQALLLIIYVVGSATSGRVHLISFWGGVMGAIALATIGAINIYSMKRWGKTGSAILASKVLSRTHFLGRCYFIEFSAFADCCCYCVRENLVLCIMQL